MKEITFINVSGFFDSGSSALVDLLKEYRGFYSPESEIRFTRDPYGIIPLENALVNQWDWINSSAAISDFREMIRKSARRKGLLSPIGFSLKRNINSDFIGITDDYVKDLCEYTYKIDFYHYKFKKSFLKYQLDRYRWAIEHVTKGKLRTANRNIETCYFAHPTQERFNNATKKYFDRLFQNFAKDDGETYIVLDQAIPPGNAQTIHRYFNKSKMLIVERDPRDMFVDDMLWGEIMDEDYRSVDAARRFITRYLAMRENMVLDDDMMIVRFEDLVGDYDNTKKRVEDFIGIDASSHILKTHFLKPQVSVKNVGIWKKYYSTYKEAIDYIAEQLPGFCIDR